MTHPQLDPFKQVFVRSPDVDHFVSRCLWMARKHPGTREGDIILVLGDTGSGKSALMRTLQRQATAEFSKAGDKCPAPRFAMPSPCTARAISREMRKAVGDPAGGGTAPENLDVLCALYPLLGVRLSIIDEAHNMGEDRGSLSDSRRRFLKRAVNDLKSIMVLAGCPELEPMILSDPELARRVKWKYCVRLFDADVDQDMEDWKTFMGGLDGATGLEKSNLASPDMARRILLSVAGRRGAGFELVDVARDFAIEYGHKKIEEDDLAEAFFDYVAKGDSRIENPFGAGRSLL